MLSCVAAHCWALVWARFRLYSQGSVHVELPPHVEVLSEDHVLGAFGLHHNELVGFTTVFATAEDMGGW
eukprot:COSAG01_NODE_2522_length_7515_cov_12.042605_4_plen_69_part_00